MNTQKSETFLKAKELVDAIQDIDLILEEYKAGMNNEDDKNRRRDRIIDRLRYIMSCKCPDFEDYNSQFSSDFVVRLVEFLTDLKAKYEEELRHLS